LPKDFEQKKCPTHLLTWKRKVGQRSKDHNWWGYCNHKFSKKQYIHCKTMFICWDSPFCSGFTLGPIAHATLVLTMIEYQQKKTWVLHCYAQPFTHTHSFYPHVFH
jgi:hypothetical protein